MNLLHTITQHKLTEVASRRQLYPIALLEQSDCFNTPSLSLTAYLKKPGKGAVIAEFKRRSPSKGYINRYANVSTATLGYMQASASALSILTDQQFFAGSNEDLQKARQINFCPILRKDFIIDEYQIIEAKSIGADAILLIARILTPAQLASFTATAKNLGLQVLIEIHNESELEPAIQAQPHAIGINNRNLDTFEVTVEKSITLAAAIPSSFTKIAESGIDSPATGATLLNQGFDGLLIGQAFMQHPKPEQAAKLFIDNLLTLCQLKK